MSNIEVNPNIKRLKLTNKRDEFSAMRTLTNHLQAAALCNMHSVGVRALAAMQGGYQPSPSFATPKCSLPVVPQISGSNLGWFKSNRLS